MKVYLAGPMRGIPEFNFPAFHAAAAKLRADGHEVFNPAERDIEEYGLDLSNDNLTGSEEEATAKHGFSIREALGADMAWICGHAEAIALMPGWKNSKGAQAEYATAMALGLTIIVLEKPASVMDGMIAEISRLERGMIKLSEANRWLERRVKSLTDDYERVLALSESYETQLREIDAVLHV